MADQGGGSSADSYIGSLISLTSKSEIRYEGILYTVDTENSNIALQNVRSYGTEGRKKDGPQILASDKVYDYIVFRGRDIKDLQVKSAPVAPAVAAPPAPPVDPAIVSMPSHYPQVSATTGPAYPAPRTAPTAPDNVALNSNPRVDAPPVVQRGATHSGYQATGWGPTPPPAPMNGSNASMPQPWPGYYGGPAGQDPTQQGQTSRPLQAPQQLLTPPSLLASAGFASQPQHPPPFLPTEPTPLNTASGTVSSAFSHHTMAAPVAAVVTPAAKGPRRLPAQPVPPSNTPPAQPNRQEASNIAAPTSAQEMKPREITVNSGSTQPVLGHPLLPLPTTPPQRQRQGIQGGYRGGGRPVVPSWPGGNGMQHVGNRRGGGRGMRMGGRGIVQPTGQTQQFTEDFDFTAMNEKFKKEEVWGELGGGATKPEEKDEAVIAPEEIEEERPVEEIAEGSLSAHSGDAESKKQSPVYDKDDFFDMISCDSLDREHGGQRSRFSEQRKVDIETFGQAQMRSGRGGRGRGGRRGGGGYRGGYGYGGYGGLGKQAPHHYGMHRNMEPNRGRGGGLPHHL